MPKKPTYKALEQKIKELEQAETDRKRTDNVLQESEKRLKAVFNQHFQFMAIITPEGRVLDVNELVLRKQGVKREDYVGKLFWESPAWRDLPEWQEIIRERVFKAQSMQAPLVIEDKYQSADGTVRYADAVFTAIRDHSGKVLYVVVQAGDITERKLVENAIEDSEARLNAFLNNSPVAMGIWDRKFRYVNANDALQKISGSPLEEHIGHTIEEVLPKVADMIRPLFEKVLSSEKALQNLELKGEVPSKSGKMSHYIVSCFPISGSDERVQFIGASFTDITELRQAEEALGESEKKYQELINLAQEGIWVIDKKNNTKFVNKSMATMLGFTPKEMTGLPLFSFMDDSERILAEENLERRIKGVKEQHDFKFLHKSGHPVFTTLETAPIFDEAGNYNGAIAGVIDITERHQVEKALKESEAKFRRLSENSTAMIYRQSIPDGKYEYVSPASIEITGYSPEEICNEPMHIRTAIHPDWADYIEEHWEKLKTGSLLPYYEFQLIHKSGEVRWIRQQNMLIYDDNGIPVATEGIVMDETKQKRITEALKESEQKFSILFNTNPAGIVITSLESGKIIEINQAILQMTGYDRQEALGRTSIELGFWPNPEDRNKITDLLKTQRFFNNLEFNYRHRSGEQGVGLFSAEVVKIHDELCIITAMFDMTENKMAQVALKESEKRYRDLFDDAPVMYVITQKQDNQPIIQEANRKFLNTLGYIKEEVIGKPLSDFYTPESVYEMIEGGGYKRALRGTFIESERSFKTVDGDIVHTIVNAVPVKDISGDDIYLRTTFLNISDYKRAESEKAELQAQLSQVQKMESIGNLAGGIAHDFNNILSSIIGFTELAIDGAEKGSSIDDDMQEVLTAGKRARDLVRQILTFARQSEEIVKPLQVKPIIEEVLKLIRSSIPTNVRIEKHLDSSSLIMGNETQINQIIMNLCTNAAHAMEETGGTLEVKLEDIAFDNYEESKKLDLKQGNYIKILVSDTGNGIDPNLIDSIFEPYFTTKGPGEGTGMGLAVVKGIIDSYHGKAFVDSTMGKGTVFTVYLPTTKKRKSKTSVQLELPPTGDERILFVDDEAAIAKMGSNMLERLGYSVTARTSSLEALEIFRAKPNEFDLVITDMTMPNMTGDHLAIELMKIQPKIPIILCTGYSKKISDEKAGEIGIKAFAYKPVVIADMARTVRKVLNDAKHPTG